MDAITREGATLIVVDEDPIGFSAGTRLPFYVDVQVCGPRHETFKKEVLQKGWALKTNRGRIERSDILAAGGAKFGRHHFEKRETAEEIGEVFGVPVREKKVMA